MNLGKLVPLEVYNGRLRNVKICKEILFNVKMGVCLIPLES